MPLCSSVAFFIVMLNFIVLNVVMQIIIELSVVVPFRELALTRDETIPSMQRPKIPLCRSLSVQGILTGGEGLTQLISLNSHEHSMYVRFI
jgi:hypothetical protein